MSAETPVESFIYTKATPTGPLRVMSLNVDRTAPVRKLRPGVDANADLPDDKKYMMFGTTPESWADRSNRLIRAIKENNADVICVQELRELPNTEPITTWLAKLGPDYSWFISYRNPSAMSFGQVIIYNRKRLFAIDTKCRWLSKTPLVPSDSYNAPKVAYGNIINGVLFARVVEGRIAEDAPYVWVFCTHLPLAFDAKIAMDRKICKIARGIACSREYCDYDIEYVICGDFNTFPQKQEDAEARKNVYKSAGLTDLLAGAPTQSGYKHGGGTFIGKEGDPFTAKLTAVHPDGHKCLDVCDTLDHIYGSKGVELLRGYIDTRTYRDAEVPELSEVDTVSDHLGLIAEIRIVPPTATQTDKNADDDHANSSISNILGYVAGMMGMDA